MFLKYTPKIKKAIKFSIKTHEVYQKQKRKGKDTAYISHPLTVGLILSLAGASEDVIVAGILHDTIEDSIDEKKVDKAMITERFGQAVAGIVMSVTETDKSLPWEVRKKQAIKHIDDFSHESLLVKSADILSNTSELIDDYNKNGEQIFDRFNAPKEKILKNYLETIGAIINKWGENPLEHDLTSVAGELQMIGAKHFMVSEPAPIMEYKDFNDEAKLKCPVCNWTGSAKGHIEYYDQLFDVTCPVCDKMLLVVNYPLAKPVTETKE